MSNYVESIERFCEKVDAGIVDGIAKSLAGALASADGATVAASDPSELRTIRDGFCANKLELNAEEADAAIAQVCDVMKHDSAKCRVTFYYLLADRTDRLSKLA